MIYYIFVWPCKILERSCQSLVVQCEPAAPMQGKLKQSGVFAGRAEKSQQVAEGQSAHPLHVVALH